MFMRPDIRERIARHEADNDERDRKESERIAKVIEQREWEESYRNWKDRMEFDLFLTTDRILEMLERQRDENEPEFPDGEWNDAFCNALTAIQEARMLTNDLMIMCTRSDKS